MAQMKSKIPLTVALMTYNRGGSYLREAIKGILEQTYQNFEFLILDNGSIDETPQVILSYKDDRIRYVRNPPGLSAWFNGASAIKISRGERILITFDDDIMLPTMLEKQMAVMDSDPGIVGVWTNIQTINKDGGTIQDYWHPRGEDQIYERGEFLADFLSNQIWPFPCTLMFQRSPRKNLAVEYNYYGGPPPKKVANIHGGDDVLKLVELNSKGKIAFLNAPLFKYRRHHQQDQHSTDPSLDVLNTYKKIKKIIKTQDFIPQDIRFTVDAFVTHYEVQHIISTTPEENLPRQSLRKISNILEKTPPSTPASQYRLLSTAILLSYHRKDGCRLLTNGIRPPGPQYSTTMHALYAWARHRTNNRNIFAGIRKESSIAILGSVFIASLLIHEARAHGLRIICCLESNKKRQGKTLLKTPIIPVEELASNTAIEHVILSSEKDQDPHLKDYIASLNPTVRITSWKDLCRTEFTAPPESMARIKAINPARSNAS